MKEINVVEFLDQNFNSYFSILRKENFYSILDGEDKFVNCYGFSGNAIGKSLVDSFSLFKKDIGNIFSREFLSENMVGISKIFHDFSDDYFLEEMMKKYSFRLNDFLDIASKVENDAESILSLKWYDSGFIGKSDRSEILIEKANSLKNYGNFYKNFHDNLNESVLKNSEFDIMNKRISNILKVVDDEAVRYVDNERLNSDLLKEYLKIF